MHVEKFVTIIIQTNNVNWGK